MGAYGAKLDEKREEMHKIQEAGGLGRPNIQDSKARSDPAGRATGVIVELKIKTTVSSFAGATQETSSGAVWRVRHGCQCTMEYRLIVILEQGIENMAGASQHPYYQPAMFQGNCQEHEAYSNQYSLDWRT
ncbi:hypothetical protein M9H77_22909 [Catharanthus roseus]|uniref:Uncharacterized protein n=1 Tax=Catharanthus roseus TaxID=4058 RepID=A0ACC0AVT2_CATRO|nr:hypothetical protein M9H77_22909 [Catharanthus roseus]